MDPTFTQSPLDMRLLIETETAGLAALNRTAGQLAELQALIAQEELANCGNAQTLTDLDFSFHLSI